MCPNFGHDTLSIGYVYNCILENKIIFGASTIPFVAKIIQIIDPVMAGYDRLRIKFWFIFIRRQLFAHPNQQITLCIMSVIGR